MAVNFKVCRLSELTVSGTEARCQEIDYKLYDDSVTDESSATIHTYMGGCVFNITEVRELNWNGVCAPRDVVDFMQVFLRGPAMNDDALVENEIRFLWDNCIVGGLTKLCEDSAYDDVISFYAHCLKSGDSGFLEFVIEQLKKNFCWNDIVWDIRGIQDSFLRNVNYYCLTPASAEALMDLLYEVNAFTIFPDVLMWVLRGMMHMTELHVQKAVFDVFAKRSTDKQFMVGVLSLLNRISIELFNDVFFELLARCTPALLIQHRVLVTLAGKGQRVLFHSYSSAPILMRYLSKFRENIHVDCEEPLFLTLLRDDQKATDFLISQGANISTALARLAERKKPLKNSAIDYAKHLEKLHNILRGEASVPETEYRKYYSEPACVKAANDLSETTFKQIQAAYDSMHPKDPMTGKEKKKHKL